MLIKEQILDSIVSEMRIIRHLATKLPQGTLDWRPTEGQRSSIDLLRYLSTAAIDLTRAMLSGTWDLSTVTGKAPKDLPLEQFDAAMERQEQAIRKALDPLTDRDLAERQAMLPTRAMTNLGAAMVNVVLKALVAYRMQLFLYAKGSGNAALSTLNCWYGVDAPPAPAPSPASASASH